MDIGTPINLRKFMLMFSRFLSPMVSMKKSFGKMQKHPSENHEKIMRGLWRANGLGAGDTGPGGAKPVVKR